MKPDQHLYGCNRSHPLTEFATEPSENSKKGLKLAHSVYFGGFRGIILKGI